MINIKDPKCIVCNEKIPNYAMPGETKAKHCVGCKLKDMIDIKHPKCKSEWCTTRTSNKKYEGYCAYCFMHLFPDKPMARNYKTKETSVVHYIKEHFKELDIIADKKIEGGCSRRRPDLFIDLGFQIIIIEIDENQHIDYDCSCENKRIMQLSLDVDHRPIVFIRFNPDDYDKGNTNISSCWHVNKLGLCCVKKNKEKEWNDRLNALHDSVKYWTTNATHKMVEIIQLFYDE
jgi:hypothetical protein